MQFEPRPENSFCEFIDSYWERSRAVCPKLRAIAGKWTFEDLLPGLSDFDTRLIFTDQVTVQEWIDMSVAIGEVHTVLAREEPRWARILEHLPGLNLMHDELTNPVIYYPEFQQWTYYKGDQQVLENIRDYLAGKAWTRRDEAFYLKRFSIYFGPYLRGIDPAVNLGKWENQYPLHSRFMHYFVPPVQSALSIVGKRGVRGKHEALRGARDAFPHPEVIDMILDALDRHYEIPEYYHEPRLTEIERLLESYLRDVYAALADKVSLIDVDPEDSPEQLKEKIAASPMDPAETYFEGAKFCRFMKGRLLFYAASIAWFDAEWLIRNELGRMVTNFVKKPLASFSLARFGEELPADKALDRLRGDVLAADVCDGVEKFVESASAEVAEGQEKERARQVAAVFEPVQIMIETLGAELVTQLRERGADPQNRSWPA